MTEPAFAGKVALVTGGTRGIGLAIARALVGAGAHVAVTGRDESRVSVAKRQFAEAGAGGVEAWSADVRSAEDVGRVVTATVDRLGGLDIVVNSAGVGVFAKVGDMTTQQWSTVVDTNLTGVFHVCHAAIPHLRQRGGGHIVNISSLAGKNPFASGAAYCASKAGLNAFSEALMQELRFDNIRVTCVLPGSVATAFSSGDASYGAEWKTSADEVAEVVLDVIRLNARSLVSQVELRPSQPRKA
jgi:3-oxoacyl-[acyl-carrier protein] reductase